jgi:hypothetical protein
MKNITIFLIALIIITLSACKTTENPEKMQKVDSLMFVIQNIDSIFQSLDSAKVTDSYSEYELTIKEFGKYFTDERDTNWNTITSYAEIKKPLRNFLRQYRDFREEIEFSKKQLTTLKNSISEGIIPSDSIDYYIDSESGAVKMLEQCLVFVVNDAGAELARFDSLQPTMLKLVEIYKNLNPKGLHNKK